MKCMHVECKSTRFAVRGAEAVGNTKVGAEWATSPRVEGWGARFGILDPEVDINSFPLQ
jgi:hypothetical protein